jgi:PPM family protein phosphatase
MRLADPLLLKTKPNRLLFLSTCIQDQGEREKQEDAFFQEKDECFAMADGVGGMPHGAEAARLAAEAAVWTYKLTKLKPYYWNDKKLLAGRIFRSANWCVYNKRREPGFEDGLASTLLVVLFSERKFYIYHTGDTAAILYRDSELRYITRNDRGDGGVITKALGINHTGPTPSFASDEVFAGDKIVMATDGITDWVRDPEWKEGLSGTIDTNEEVTKRAQFLLKTARDNGSTDNCSVCLISCLAGKSIVADSYA